MLNPALYWGNNLIRGYPDPTLADGTQPIWWNVTNDETLTEEDAIGESITMSNERVLKLVISADGGGVDFAYQDFDAADEPTLFNNVTIVSAGIEVYQKSTDTAGTITLELYDVTGAMSLGTATTTTQDSKVLLKIENITYQDSMRFRLTHSANSAIVYAANPMLNIGPTLRPWRSRQLRNIYKEQAYILSGGTATTFTDLDVSSHTSPNTVFVHLTGYYQRTSSGGIASVRRNGSTTAVTGSHDMAVNGNGLFTTLSARVACDANQVIEYQGAGPGNQVYIGIPVYEEWE